MIEHASGHVKGEGMLGSQLDRKKGKPACVIGLIWAKPGLMLVLKKTGMGLNFGPKEKAQWDLGP